jgi:hypothetical protein
MKKRDWGVLAAGTLGLGAFAGLGYFLRPRPAALSSGTVQNGAPSEAVQGVSVSGCVGCGTGTPSVAVSVNPPVIGATGYKVTGGRWTCTTYPCAGFGEALGSFSFQRNTYTLLLGQAAPGLEFAWQIQACNGAGCGPVATVTFTTPPTPAS